MSYSSLKDHLQLLVIICIFNLFNQLANKQDLMKRNLLLLAALWVVSQGVVHCQSRSHFIQDSLDNYINSALKDWRLPGVAVCVVKDSKVVYMKGFGVKESGGTDSVDVNTLFMIGSNTKAFTATAIAMLEDEKKLSLNDKVTKWLPQFKLDNSK